MNVEGFIASVSHETCPNYSIFLCMCISPERFGHGYTVTVRVGGDSVDMYPVTSFVEQTFPGAVQQELHHNMVQYQLFGNQPVAQILATIREVKGKLNIEDYSVCQTTLDQVMREEGGKPLLIR